jgi:hypothetical protein
MSGGSFVQDPLAKLLVQMTAKRAYLPIAASASLAAVSVLQNLLPRF